MGRITASGGRIPALADTLRRQSQFTGESDVGAQQLFHDGVPNELRTIMIAGRLQPGIQRPEEFFIDGDGQQFLTWSALIGHNDLPIPLSCREHKKNVDMGTY